MWGIAFPLNKIWNRIRLSSYNYPNELLPPSQMTEPNRKTKMPCRPRRLTWRNNYWSQLKCVSMSSFYSYVSSQKLFLFLAECVILSFHFPVCFLTGAHQKQPPQNHDFSPKEALRSGKWLPAWELGSLSGTSEIFVMMSQGVHF